VAKSASKIVTSRSVVNPATPGHTAPATSA
jgi:hypothetical protein